MFLPQMDQLIFSRFFEYYTLVLYKRKDRFYCGLKVRTRRLELPRPNGHQPLKLARLPIPPRALEFRIANIVEVFEV